MSRVFLGFVLTVWACMALAVEPDELLADPKLEERARAISANVRCVVCQNEPIDSSNAGVARDLRLLIRERLLAGDSDQEIYDFLVMRYGAFVLFNPPLTPATYALWFGPFVFLLIGAGGVIFMLRKRQDKSGKSDKNRDFTDEETLQLQRLIQNKASE